MTILFVDNFMKAPSGRELAPKATEGERDQLGLEAVNSGKRELSQAPSTTTWSPSLSEGGLVFRRFTALGEGSPGYGRLFGVFERGFYYIINILAHAVKVCVYLMICKSYNFQVISL